MAISIRSSRFLSPKDKGDGKTSNKISGVSIIQKIKDAIKPSGDKSSPLPLIGHLSIPQQYTYLAMILSLFLFIMIALVVRYIYLSGQLTTGVSITGDMLMHSQRLAKSVPAALAGNPQAFEEMQDSYQKMTDGLASLSNDEKQPVHIDTPELILPRLREMQALWKKGSEDYGLILSKKEILLKVGSAVQTINTSNQQFLDAASEIASLEIASHRDSMMNHASGGRSATIQNVVITNHLAMLTQRLGKNTNALLVSDDIDLEVAFFLGKDTNTFRDLLEALEKGDPVRRIAKTTDPDAIAKIEALKKRYLEFQSAVSAILGELQHIIRSKQVARSIFIDSELQREKLSELSLGYTRAGSVLEVYFVTMFLLSVLIAISLVGLFMVYRTDQSNRALEIEVRRQEAERQGAVTKDINEQNQKAFLRLMNELADVASGDLTVQTTVTEDITGAIADSINVTVEELRNVVLRINQATAEVSTASQQAQNTSTRLLAAQNHQSKGMRTTGEAVLRMATDINVVSENARNSVAVARESVVAAQRGAEAVANSIAGMNEIREQIQETSKRIKRLGESSQEIGEIVELISDITEQTNVLALNAAIQAASAGDAGRGFTVVAEEVQRLAERSTEATKQIATLVKTIQKDTHDAVAAMEKSTEGVVEGAKLSDAAGKALNDIGNVSGQLANLIQDISSTTSVQAQSASTVAKNIQTLLALSEQTAQGTEQNAQSVRHLAQLAQELKQSVSGFKVA